MPMFNFVCEKCGMPDRRWAYHDSPPRFCSAACRVEGLRGQAKTPRKYTVSPEAHEAIKRLYQQAPEERGAVANLAKRLRLPRWKVSRYAISQGWIAVEKKGPVWSQEETEALQRLARYCPEVVSRKMKEKGYNRSSTACVLKMRRMKMNQNLKGQSSRSLAECFGVDDHWVTNRIKRGALKAKKRGTARTEAQGGDMWYIKDKDIREFILENVHEIDLRKVDKYWYTDIVAGAGGLN